MHLQRIADTSDEQLLVVRTTKVGGGHDERRDVGLLTLREVEDLTG